jgi:hypothetical protein
MEINREAGKYAKAKEKSFAGFLSSRLSLQAAYPA